jgi:hypothetical protein
VPTEQSEERYRGMNKMIKNKRGSQSNTRIDGIIHMPNERMKALEAAYLTKLHRPNKRNTPLIMNKTNAEEQA